MIIINELDPIINPFRMLLRSGPIHFTDGNFLNVKYDNINISFKRIHL